MLTLRAFSQIDVSYSEAKYSMVPTDSIIKCLAGTARELFRKRMPTNRVMMTFPSMTLFSAVTPLPQKDDPNRKIYDTTLTKAIDVKAKAGVSAAEIEKGIDSAIAYFGNDPNAPQPELFVTVGKERHALPHEPKKRLQTLQKILAR